MNIVRRAAGIVRRVPLTLLKRSHTGGLDRTTHDATFRSFVFDFLSFRNSNAQYQHKKVFYTFVVQRLHQDVSESSVTVS